MKKRNLVIGLLIMLSVIVSGFTFAFWAGSLSGDDLRESNTIAIGAGQAVTTVVTLDSKSRNNSGTLVPAGRADNSVGTSVESIVFTFELLWDETVDLNNDSYDGTEWNLATVISNVKLGTTDLTLAGEGPSYTAGLLNFVVAGAAKIELAASGNALVTITLTLTEPSSQESYTQYANGSITFDVTFTTSAPSAPIEP